MLKPNAKTGNDMTALEPEDRPITRRELGLEVKNFRSEMRLLVFLSIAANQTLAHISLPDGVSTGALAIVALKLFLSR